MCNSFRHVISKNPFDIIITHSEGLFVTQNSEKVFMATW